MSLRPDATLDKFAHRGAQVVFGQTARAGDITKEHGAPVAKLREHARRWRREQALHLPVRIWHIAATILSLASVSFRSLSSAEGVPPIAEQSALFAWTM